MIQAPKPERPLFNDALYQALKGHTLDHYSIKPLLEKGARMKMGLPEQKGQLPKDFNVK